MATTYKGLTIRIGGDATSLNKSLRGVNMALAQTQRELKKTNKAASLDPSSMSAYNAQLGYMSQRATNVASKLSVLKRALEQVDMSEKSLAVDGTLKSYQDLIDASSEFGAGVEDVAVKLAHTNEVFNMTKDNLARTHKEMSRLSKAATKVEESIVSDAMAIALEGKSLDDVIGKYRKLSDGTERSAESMSSISDQISQMSKLFEPGKNGMFDVSAIKEYFETLGSSIGLSKSYVNDLLAVVKSINKEYSDQAKLSENMVAVKSAQQAERNKQDFERLTELESELKNRDEALAKIVAERRSAERDLIDQATAEYRESISSDVVKTVTSYDNAISLAGAIAKQTERRLEAQIEINRLQEESNSQQVELGRRIVESNTKLESLRREEEKVVESVKSGIRQSAREEIEKSIQGTDKYKQGYDAIQLKASADRESVRNAYADLIDEAKKKKEELESRKGAMKLSFDVVTNESGTTIKELSEEMIGLYETINDIGSNNNLRTLVDSLSKAGLDSYKASAEALESTELLDYIGYLNKLKSAYDENKGKIDSTRRSIEGINAGLEEILSYDVQELLDRLGIELNARDFIDDLDGFNEALDKIFSERADPDLRKRYEAEIEPINQDIEQAQDELKKANGLLLYLIDNGKKLKGTAEEVDAEIESFSKTGEASNTQFLNGWLNSLGEMRDLLSGILSDAEDVTKTNFYPANNAFNRAIGHEAPEVLPMDYERPIDQITQKVRTLLGTIEAFSEKSKEAMTAAFDPEETARLITAAERKISNLESERTNQIGAVSRRVTGEVKELTRRLVKEQTALIDDSTEHATEAEKQRIDAARSAVKTEEENNERLNDQLEEVKESYDGIADSVLNVIRNKERFGKEALTFDFLEGLSEEKLTDVANAIHNRIVSINADLQSARENIERLQDVDYRNSEVQKAVDKATEEFAGEDIMEMSAKRRAEYEDKAKQARIDTNELINKSLTEEQRRQRELYEERNAAEKAISTIRERSLAAYNKDVTRRLSDQDKLVAFEQRKLEIQRETKEEIDRATEAQNEQTEAMRNEATELRKRLSNIGAVGDALTVEDVLDAADGDWKETTSRIAECRGEISSLIQESNDSIRDATAKMSSYGEAVASTFDGSYEKILKRQKKIDELQDRLNNPYEYAEDAVANEIKDIEEKFKNKPTMFVAWRTQFESILNNLKNGVKMTTDESADEFRELIVEINRYMNEIDTEPFDSLKPQFEGIREAALKASKLATGDAEAMVKEFLTKSRSMVTSYAGTVLKNIEMTRDSVDRKAQEIAQKANIALNERYGSNKNKGILGIQESAIERWNKKFQNAMGNVLDTAEELEARERELAELQDVISGSGNSPDNERAKRIAALQEEIVELQERSRSTVADTVGSYDGMSEAVRRLRMEQAHVIDSAVDDVHELQTESDKAIASTKSEINEIGKEIVALTSDRDTSLAMYDEGGISLESTRLRELTKQIEENKQKIENATTAFERYKQEVEGWDTSDKNKQKAIAEREAKVLESNGKLIAENAQKEKEAEETRAAIAARRARIESEYQTKTKTYYDEIATKEAKIRSIEEAFATRRAQIIREANEKSLDFEFEVQGHLIDVDALREEAASAIRQAMIEALGKRMPKLTSELFNVANGNTGIEHMSESIKLMAGNVDMSDASVERLVGTLTDLTSRLGESQNALEALTEATRIRDNINEIILAEAELRKQLEDLGRIDAPSVLEKKLYTLNSTIQKISNAYNSLLKRGDAFEKYLEFDKGNANIAEVALRAVSDAARAALENIQMANEKLGHFDVEHIRAITDANKSVEKQLIDSQSAWLTASTNLKQYEGDLIDVQKAIAILEDQLSRVRVNGNEVEDGVVVSEEGEILRGLEDPEEALRRLREEETRLKNLTGELGAEVRKLWKDFEAAKERRDFEDASAGVEQWRAELQKVSATIVDMTQKKAISEVFGDTSELDEFEKRLKAAVTRVETLNKITDLGNNKTFDSSNVELAKRRFDALADVESIVVMYTESLNDLLETTDTSAIDAVAAKYGSVENAVGRVIQRYGSLRQAMAEFVSGGDDELLVDVEDIARADALLQRLRSIQSLRTDIDAARKLVSDSELSSYKPFSFDRDIFEPVVKSLETLKASSRDAFEPLDRRFKNLTAVIEDAKSKVKAYDDQMKASGETAELVAARDREIERAVAAADERAKLLPDNLAKVAAGLESMGRVGADQRLIDTYGNLNDAIDSLGKKFVGVQAQAEAFKNAIRDFANENELGEEWANALIRVSSKGNISDALFDMILADLPEVAEEGANKLFAGIRESASGLRKSLSDAGNIAEDLGLASIMSYFQSIEAKAAETGDVVRDSFKKSKKIELDDSFSKELDKFSKRIKDFGFNNTGIDEMLEDLDALGKQIKSNTDYYDELLKLLKENPGSDFVRNALGEAAPALMQKLQERIEKTKAAIDDLKKNANLDWGAISSGTVDAELEKASVAFDKAEDKVKKLREELKSAKQALEDMPSGVDTTEARAEVDKLERELNEAEAAAIQTKERLEQMGNTKTFVKLNFQTVTDSATGESLAKSYKNSWKDIHDEIDKGSNELMQALQNVSQYVERMGDKIVESSSTIDAAYRDMRKTVNGTESQFKSLRNEAIKFSQTHAVSADTILEMEALGGQLGIVAEQLGDFGRIASNLDIATDISANDIALQLGQISNIMSDLDYSNLENFADALVRLGNNAAAQESSIMDIAQRISAVANVTSMTTPQLLGWAAAIAETGQKSESAATALVKTVNNIAQAVAHGGNDLEAFAKVANMTAEEFENTWRNSSSDALKAFVVGLAGLTEESADAIAALESVGIKAVRQETSLLALSQTIDKVDENILMSTDAFNGISDAWGRAGDSANEAEQKSKGFSGTLQIMQNNVSNLAASLGDGLIPFMNVLSGVLSGLTAFFSMLPGPVKSSVTAIGGLLAIMGMIGPEINEIKKGWDDMNSKVEGGLTGINGVVYNTGTAIGGLVDSLKSLLASLKDVGVAFVKNATSGSAANAALSTSVEGVAAAEANATVSGVAMGASVDGVAAAEAGATATTVTLEGALAGLGTAATGVGAALKTLWGVVWPVALVGLVISGIGMIKEQFDEWKERQDLIAASTQSFAYSLNNAKASAEEYAAGLKSISTTAEQVHDELGTFYEQQASFADTINESMGNVGKNSAQIDSYAETIKRLSGNINDNAAELELLQKAVDGYNELAGSSISIIDDTTGAISIQMDALDMLTESYKKNAETQAWMDIYKNAVKEAADATYQLKKADLETEQNRKRMNELLKDGIGWFSKEHEEYQRLSDANREYAKNMDHLREIEAQRKKDVENVEEIIADLDTEQENLTESVEDYSSALSIAGQSVDAFTDLSDEQKQKINEVQAALNDNGDSLTNYGEFSKDQLIELANSWDKSVEHIIAKIHQMQKAEEEANAGKPSDQALEEFKRKNEAIYEQEKRDRDDFYDSEKRLRDLYYDDRKNQLDDEYDIFKAEKDKEYEWEKRLREDAYDDKKAELDAEYEYEKRIRDDAYDDRKAQLDAEYEWEKRLRDDAYDDYKKTLDDAYDEAKQVSDDWLDDYKDSLDAEVDAFEKATDERIKLMEEEYEAKKKLIDEQEEADTSAIDAQIQAIKDQTAAEEKAAKMAERQQKIAEATAKRDKYSQGSKAWEKYNLELENLQTEYANEDEKERREQLIEELEKEKDAVKEGADSRRDILKESLDQEKEAYKTHRDEQKEELKKYNEEQYEEQKRLAEAQLKLIKDENDAALLVKKRANDDELTEIKRRLDQEAEDYKRANDDELTEIKRRLDQEAEDYKRANDDELTEIKRRLDQETEDYKRSQDAHLELLKYYHDQELLEIKRRHDDELTDIKNHIDDENEAYKNGGQPAVDALNAVGDTAVTTSTKVATAITDASSSLGELGNLSTDAKGKITGALGAIKEGLTSGDPEVVAATQSLVSNMSDELYGIVLAAQQNGIQVPAEISKAIMENANLSKQSLDTLVGTITGSFGPISPAARTEMENAMLAMSTTLTSKTPETVTAANQFVMDNSAALSKLVEAAKGVGIEVPPALANAINSTPEVLTSSMNELANTITSGLGPLSPNAKTKIEEMFAAINSGLTSPDPNRAESMKTLLEDLSEPLGSIVTTAAGYGVNVPPAIVKAMAENVEKEKSKLPPVFKSLFSEIDNKDVWDVIAHNDAVGYINKLIEKFRDNVVPKVAELALNVAKTFAGAHEINSPSRLFGWYAEMDAEGFMRQWEKSTYEMMRMMFGTSDDIANAFDVDYSDTDAVDQMLDQMRENHDRVVEQTKTMMDDMLMTMREREAELRNQAERMARIMEDGFDPTLTAAYEAIDTIDAGKLRRQQAVAAAQSVSNVTNAPVINISIPQVVMHEKADLTAFSEQIARKVRRELAASLG